MVFSSNIIKRMITDRTTDGLQNETKIHNFIEIDGIVPKSYIIIDLRDFHNCFIMKRNPKF